MPANPDDGARLAAKVADLVVEAERVLLKRIADAIRSGMTAPDWETQTLARLQLLQRQARDSMGKLDTEVAEAIRNVLLEAHTTGAANALIDLEEVGINPAVTPGTVSTLPLTAKVAAQASAAILSTPALLSGIYRNVVAAGVAEVLGGEVTRLQAAQHVLDKIAVNGITGFKDKAGRQWSLTSYVEMAVRTGAGQAAVDGHTQTLSLAGVDLVLVSDSPRECPVCRPWEKKILSLSGRVGAIILPSVTGGKPVRVDVAASLQKAKSAGLFHANCSHSLAAYLPGATRVTKPDSNPDGYDQKQRQRGMERRIREWKRRQAVSLDDASAAKAALKVRQWQSALRTHVDRNDLKRLSRREQIEHAR